MKQFAALRSFLCTICLLGMTLTAWAVQPVTPKVFPAAQSSQMAQAATEASMMDQHGSVAAAFILGMSLLLLVPVAIELVAPSSVGRAFRLRLNLMRRNAWP